MIGCNTRAAAAVPSFCAFKLLFCGEDPITVGAIHESPAVPKSQSVRLFFHYTGDS